MLLAMMTTSSSLPILHQWKRKKANPAEFEGAGNMVSILTEVISAPEAIRDILGAKEPIKKLMLEIIKKKGLDYGIDRFKDNVTEN